MRSFENLSFVDRVQVVRLQHGSFVHVCPDCHGDIPGVPMAWSNRLLCLPCWVRRSNMSIAQGGLPCHGKGENDGEA